MPFRPPRPEWARQFVIEIRKLDASLDDAQAQATAVAAWPSTLLLPPAQAAAQVVAARQRQRLYASRHLKPDVPTSQQSI